MTKKPTTGLRRPGRPPAENTLKRENENLLEAVAKLGKENEWLKQQRRAAEDQQDFLRKELTRQKQTSMDVEAALIRAIAAIAGR